MCNNEQSVLKSSTLSISISIIVVSLFAGITYFIFDTVYKTQPNPYLDEIFHIPQAQKYCKWLFGQWDPKITTLPGLYLLSVGALTPLTAVLGRDLCNVYFLRFTNLVGCFINFYVLYGIQQKLHPGKKEIGLLSAFNLATFPLLYFFTFLYYTDTISTSLVLLMYLFHLYGHNFLSAASGFIAVIVRQTNIIWVGFILLKIVENVLKDKAIAYKRKVTPPTLRSSKYFQILLLTIQQSWKSGFSSFSTLIIDILRESSLFIIVCLSFVTFLVLTLMFTHTYWLITDTILFTFGNELQIPQSSWWPLIIEFFIYTAINALTIYLFLSRTFTWADSPELQRFLW
uniref:Dol-P-Glc:Glc(2)Man(9)GlcNAc(2)-PP-Dol alpha-1,2-glucosyltransferase n=1 Tax=Timema poppense TaxID=170557 RepID=A0A7R9GVL0_TIMPO|nr:unnamed protein product [Timema poppensis]